MGRALVCSVALAVVLLAGCGGSSKPKPPTLRPVASAFADPGGPLKVVNRGTVASHNGITIHDVAFQGRSGPVDAYVVTPAKHGKAPAVILLHGSGGSRSDFLPSAITYAQHGAVGLTMTAPSDKAPAPAASVGALGRLRLQESLTKDDVVAVRRAVDYLSSLPSVDPKRIGVVGWSEGARTGAVVAGVEPRIKALDLMSGGALPVATYVAAAPSKLRPAVQRSLTTLDPLHWIALARRGTLFLQDGRQDTIVPQKALGDLAAAAPKGSRVQWYPAGHPLNRKAVSDQVAWLSQRLGLRG